MSHRTTLAMSFECEHIEKEEHPLDALNRGLLETVTCFGPQSSGVIRPGRNQTSLCSHNQSKKDTQPHLLFRSRTLHSAGYSKIQHS